MVNKIILSGRRKVKWAIQTILAEIISSHPLVSFIQGHRVDIAKKHHTATTSPNTKRSSHRNFAPKPTMLQRVSSSDWKSQPFRKPQITEWIVPLPVFQIEYLLRGYAPQHSGDPWFVYADGPDEHGGARVHFFKSSTGLKVVEMLLHIPNTGHENNTATKPPQITHILWESDKESVPGNSAERAKHTCQEVYTRILACQPSEDEEISSLLQPTSQTFARRSLASLRAALDPSPLPQASQSTISALITSRIVDTTGSIIDRPSTFHCLQSP
ncbi:hypothetical protein EJ08DRAFT_338640 [Tothia fuscella]|uniref:Uncharacterized protein n=1 Tax=Tothia fuscella TaxID=1048955 RepID=A0A9P4P1B9_9PEZI|nr:hypothetical protein EJ08DRAFT_338640 [Tothia fuscella]